MPDSYTKLVDRFPIGNESLACGLASASGRPVITRDVLEEPLWKPWLHLAKEYNFRGCWSFPIETPHLKPFGTFALYFGEPHDATPQEMSLAEVITQTAAIIVSRHSEAQERSHAEQTQRESEERLRQFGEASQDVLWIRDAETLQWTYLTPAFETIYGLTREKALVTDNYRNWLDLIVPEDQDHATASIDRVRAGEQVAFEFRIRRSSDGEIRWMRNTDFPILDVAGKITLIGGIGSDITELKQAEEALTANLADATLLHNLAHRLMTEESAQAIYDDVLTAALAITRSDAGTVQVYEPESQALILLATRNFDRKMTSHFHRIDAQSKTACGIALRTGQRTFTDFDDADPEPACIMHVQAGYRSAQATPLLTRSGKPLGMLNTHWHAVGHRPSERELRFLDLLARQAADLIEQQLAHAALRESEERLRQFGEASRDVLWIRDADKLQWTYLTPAFETIYGESREKALSGDNFHSWLDLIVPEDQAKATDALRRVKAGEHVTFDYRIRRPADGAIRWLRNTDFPIINATGATTLIGGIGHDLTELRETEFRLQTLIEGIPQLVWRAVESGTWTWASPQWTAYTGLSEADSQGWGWLNAVHPDDRVAANKAWAHAIEADGFEVEYRLRCAASGGYRWFQTRATPVRDEAKDIIEWLGTSTDIEDLKGTQAAKLEAEEQFRLFVENVHEYALVQTDPQGLISNWNPGAQRLFGYTPEQTLTKDFSFLMTPEDQDRGIFPQELALVRNGQRHEDARWFVRQDGTRFWARWITEPMCDETGRFRGLAKIMRDETEREQAEASTRHSLAEKEELLKEVHHRVKNNLQVIISLLNMQSSQIRDEQVLSLFQESRNRVLAISSIHELLYRAESFANIKLTDYARQLVPGLVRFYGLDDRVQVEVLGDGATLELERAVPYGMLLNELVSNACKHAFPPRQTGSITISVQPENDAIVLTVADTGIGIPAGFDYRKASSLGLKLVRGLVQQLRGTIEITSNPGTSVSVRFAAAGIDQEE